MSEHETGPRRRGRPPRLTREQVVAAAGTVLRRDGVAALTMRRVAQEVGSTPMSLYHHVADKDELLVLLLEEEAAQLAPPPLPDAPRDRIVAVAAFLRAVLDARPWVLEAIAPGARFAPSALPLVEEIVAGFAACGLPLDDAARAYRAVWNLIAGELTIRHAAGAAGAGAAGAAGADARSDFARATMAALDPEATPLLAQIGSRWWEVADSYDAEAAIAALVDGLIARAGVAPEA